MAYDEALATRIRLAVGPRADVAERKMFGGLCFLLDGKMFCGIVDRELMARVGPAGHADALGRPHARPMDFTGRPMTGYVFVGPAGCRTQPAVAAWVARCLAFVATIARTRPRKRAEPRPRKATRNTRRKA